MNVLDILYSIVIMPLALIFETIYDIAYQAIGDPGLAIIALSLTLNLLVLPLYMRADKIQAEERAAEDRIRDGVAHFKKYFKGDERMLILQTYYRQNNYRPTDVFKGSISLLLQIPFFIAAYTFLSNLEALQGISFLGLPDLGKPDGLILLGDLHVNLMPFLMTGINLVSCVIFTKGMPLKSKMQLYVMALFFLVFLYNSPSGLVFYWTLNNLFSLGKSIFYKLKNPKKAIAILLALIGTATLVTAAVAPWLFTPEGLIFVIVLGVALFIPLVLYAIKAKSSLKLPQIPESPGRSRLFFTGALFLAVLTGLLIPTAVIGSAPRDFVDIFNFFHPLWYVASSTCIALGLFVLWFGVFYKLCNQRAKTVFEVGIWIACIMALVDYLFFGNNLGVISNSLRYESGLVFAEEEIWANVAALAAIAIVLLATFRFCAKHGARVLAVATLVLAVMTGINISTIVMPVQSAFYTAEEYKDSIPAFTLSKEGQNVVVIMLDRAMGEYIPFIMNEKPELKDVYSGFTYYSNVISYGGFTNVGIPALFGGYEYTPTKMNERSEELMMDKHDEALRVMPVTFAQNGYDVTVIDAPYAGYNEIPESAVYEDCPNISVYLAGSKFMGEYEGESPMKNDMRNFFYFSVMKASPLFVQPAQYDGGRYHYAPIKEAPELEQVTEENCLISEGMSEVFLKSYTVLTSLTEMTTIVDSDQNTFLTLSNETTHSPTSLQEPDYKPAQFVDNTAYEIEPYRVAEDGSLLEMRQANGPEVSVNQIKHYQVNMASLLAIGEWIEYLKENDVYDNTRIIIVSDHGRPTGQMPQFIIDDGSDLLCDLEFYYPLLMVKDFGATEFTTSDEFMTNADTPTLAFAELIENPVNPATGVPINSDAKLEDEQYVLASLHFNISEGDGYTFEMEDTFWLSVHDDMRDPGNWTSYKDMWLDY